MVTIKEADLPEIKDWLAGISKATPAVMDKVLHQLAVRLSCTMATSISDTLMRMQSVNIALQNMEKVLFSPDRILNFSGIDQHEELETLYKQALNAQLRSLEFVRKFILQNKETFSAVDSKVDDVYNMMSGLSPAALRQAQQFLARLVDETGI
jgi:hypothetical protein